MIAAKDLRYGDVIRYREPASAVVYLYLGRGRAGGHLVLVMSPSMTPEVTKMFLTDAKAWEKVS